MIPFFFRQKRGPTKVCDHLGRTLNDLISGSERLLFICFKRSNQIHFTLSRTCSIFFRGALEILLVIFLVAFKCLSNGLYQGSAIFS